MHKRDVCQVDCVDMAKVDRVRPLLGDKSGLATVFKALADETHLKVAYALATEEICVCEMAALLETTVQNASHHLRYLKRTGLAVYLREGKLVFYSLVPEVATILDSVQSWQGGKSVVSTRSTD